MEDEQEDDARHRGRDAVGPQQQGAVDREPADLLGREAGRWILASGVTPGEFVVCHRAQALLSEEFRSAADVD